MLSDSDYLFEVRKAAQCSPSTDLEVFSICNVLKTTHFCPTLPFDEKNDSSAKKQEMHLKPPN